MFKFTKAFIKNDTTKIATDYVKITDNERIAEIIRRRFGNANMGNDVKINSNSIDKNIHRDRIDAIKRIKKD